MPKIWLVVPAGGVGARMRSVIPKQYLPLNGVPIIVHTLQALCQLDRIDHLVVGISPTDQHWKLSYAPPKLHSVVNAGNERADTVLNCLQMIIELGGGKDWVLVHDAVRPCVSLEQIDDLIDRVTIDGTGGILATPLNDTIKRCVKGDDQAPKIDKTVSREHLWRAMTPQMFRVEALADALIKAKEKGVIVSDEASAMEAVGMHPLLVSCSTENIKITTSNDLDMAEMIIKARITDD